MGLRFVAITAEIKVAQPPTLTLGRSYKNSYLSKLHGMNVRPRLVPLADFCVSNANRRKTEAIYISMMSSHTSCSRQHQRDFDGIFFFF